jgi:hypothetical protein
MLSAVIRKEHSYPAMLNCCWTTGTPGVPSSQSSRTRDEFLQVSTDMQDRDRAVLRRSEPSSRTTLTGEQPDPWDLLQPQDVMSRHRVYSFISWRKSVLSHLLICHSCESRNLDSGSSPGWQYKLDQSIQKNKFKVQNAKRKTEEQ